MTDPTAPPVLSPLLRDRLDESIQPDHDGCCSWCGAFKGHTPDCLVPDITALLDTQRATVARLTADYDKVLTAWAESRERHLQAEAEVARLREAFDSALSVLRAVVPITAESVAALTPPPAEEPTP